MISDKQSDLFMLNLFERRAALKVANTFRVNRYEVWMVMAFVAVLLLTGRKSCSKRGVFDQVTGNTKSKRKMEGYWHGIINKGLIIIVTLKNGYTSYSLTPLGAKVCKLFESELKRLELQERERQAKRQKDIIHYNSVEDVEVNTINDLGAKHYKAVG